MAQVKVYGLRRVLAPLRERLSDAIHVSLMEVFQLPKGKRFQRFILLDEADFIYPEDRGYEYTIIELVIFEGRSSEVKKALIHRLFETIEGGVGIAPHSVEITIIEIPQAHWGIRGMLGDALALDYEVTLSKETL